MLFEDVDEEKLWQAHWFKARALQRSVPLVRKRLSTRLGMEEAMLKQ